MRNDVYLTKNLNIASYLYTCNLQLVGTKRVNSEVFFEFSPKEKAEALVDDYFTGTAKVNPR